ncbi:MAG TPA: hypothetical protein VHQ47_06845 [Phycisphaerae bacterium]|nr:hypothetical protein [Phycisphaerae bacterium]
MTPENFQRLLDALASRNPFHPFRVELVGGRRFEVDHARAMVVRDGVAVFLAPGGVPIWFDHEGVTAIVGDTADAA